MIILAKAIHAEWLFQIFFLIMGTQQTNKTLQVNFMHHNKCSKSINAGH